MHSTHSTGKNQWTDRHREFNNTSASTDQLETSAAYRMKTAALWPSAGSTDWYLVRPFSHDVGLHSLELNYMAEHLQRLEFNRNQPINETSQQHYNCICSRQRTSVPQPKPESNIRIQRHIYNNAKLQFFPH